MICSSMAEQRQSTKGRAKCLNFIASGYLSVRYVVRKRDIYLLLCSLLTIRQSMFYLCTLVYSTFIPNPIFCFKAKKSDSFIHLLQNINLCSPGQVISNKSSAFNAVALLISDALAYSCEFLLYSSVLVAV